MSIFSKTLLYDNSNNYGFWQKITKTYLTSDVHHIEYNSFYECYTMYSYDCYLFYSKNLIEWKSLSNNFIYNPNNKHFYKVTKTHSGDNYVISIAEMTSIGEYGTAITLDSIAYNAYSYGYIYNIYKLGNYYVLPYSLHNSTQTGSRGTNNAYQKIAYTQDFKTWKKTTIYSETNVSNYHDQIRPLGSSGSKFVLFSSTSSGFRPVTFTSPTQYTNQNVLWSGGNMTAATGFYCNGIWHYCECNKYTTYLSGDGSTFTKCSNDYWQNPYMQYVQNHYITSNASTGELRVYDDSFSTFSIIQIPCSKISRILGIMDNFIYVYGGDNCIYRTNIENLIT